MRVSRVYYEGKLSTSELITLPQETSHYVLNVLRLKIGSNLIIFNGEGGQYHSSIAQYEKKNAIVKINEYDFHNRESFFNIHLAQSISRGEKMDWIIQKAVELGVTSISPILTEFSSIKLDTQRSVQRLHHWQKIMISACEQSGRTKLPTLFPIKDYGSWIKDIKEEIKIYCDPKATEPITKIKPSTTLLILIGPEGGLSPKEIEMAQSQFFKGVSLGPRILRTETAALTALSIAQSCWGDLTQ